jgi:ribonuclease HII
VGKPEKYKEKLEQRFGLQDPKIEFTVESKADNNYPVTGAASVVAKV